MTDFKLALRQLAKSRGFTTVAVVSLGLGIGSSIAVFSIYDAILLRSLPVPEPRQLRIVQWSGSDVRMTSFEGKSVQEASHWRGADCVPHPTFVKLRESCASQAELFGFCPVHDTVVGTRGETFVADGMMVSENFFQGLAVTPFLGRCLRQDEDYRGAPNTVISYGLWQKCFGRDQAAIGQGLTLDGTTYTVVGILPPGFNGVQPGNPCQFYVPLSAGAPFLYAPITENWHWFVRLMARLKPGATDAQFGASLNVAFASEAKQIMQNPHMTIEPGRRGTAYDRNTYGKTLRLMLGVIGLVMLVACANLAGLTLARGAHQRHEMAVRAALGASRWRLIKQSLSESLVLSLIGGSLGAVLAVWGRAILARLLTGSASGLRYDFSLDLLLLGFCLGMTLLTAVGAGLLPALRAGQTNPAAGLKSRGTLGTPRLRMGRILVAAQICVAMLLLTGAILYARTMSNLTRINAGFAVDKLVLVGLNIRAGVLAGSHPVAFYERIQNELLSIPGIQSAALSGFPLLADRQWSGGFGIRGMQIDPQASSGRLTVSESFFPTLGIPILQGRGFAATDTGDAPRVVVINEKLERMYLAGENPVGLIFNMLGQDWRIVGVCRDAKYDNIKSSVQPMAYFAYRQMFFKPSISKNLNTANLSIRTALSPTALSAAIARVMGQIDPNVAITTIRTQKEVRDQGISQERLLATLSTFLAILAIMLSCIGLYGLMAYNVARRSGEIAIRIAVGAHPSKIAFAVLREALGLCAIGVAIGLPAVLAMARLIKSQLYGVRETDPPTLIGVIAALLTAALLAAWAPARRASRIDPVVALRAD